MKKLLAIILFLGVFYCSKADGPVATGQAQINGGVGFSTWGLPVYIGLDAGVHPDVTIGGQLSYRGYRERISSVNYNHSIFGILGNANYHFNTLLELPSEWNLYAGLNLGFYVWNSPNTYPGGRSSGLGLGAQVGGRYYFNNKWGINLEITGGNSLSGGKIGITLRL